MEVMRLALILLLVSSAAYSAQLPLIGFMSGLEPGRLSGHELIIMPGFTVDHNGYNVVRFDQRTVVDINEAGCDGLDQGTAEEGASYQLYTAYNPSTGDACFVVSESIRIAGVDQFGNEVTYPPGYQAHRKLRFAFRYREAWGGIPAFHLSHWPMPSIRLTVAEAAAPYRVAAGLQTVGEWKTIELDTLLPDAARLARIGVWIDAVDWAGTCYLRTTSRQSTGLPVGTVTPREAIAPGSMWTIRVTSNQPNVNNALSFQARTTGGCRFRSIYVMGYDMTEPS